jgi:hypothetical protein
MGAPWGARYIMRDARAYACSSFLNGAACANGTHVRRDRVESVLLNPIRNDLLSPERMQRMAKELQQSYLEAALRATEAPHELQELAARIERLRERLRRGDPDMPVAGAGFDTYLMRIPRKKTGGAAAAYVPHATPMAAGRRRLRWVNSGS